MEEMKRGFNKQSFANLLIKAKGSRTMTKFADDAGMSVAHISRMANEKLETPPSPETINKLVPNGSANGVTYEDLMIAAGHITSSMAEQMQFDNIIEIDSEEHRDLHRSASEEQIAMNERNKRWEMQRIQERDDRMKFESMCMSIIMSQVSILQFPWRMENKPSETLSMSFRRDLQINFIESPIKTWEFDFRHFREFNPNGKPVTVLPPSMALNVWGRLAVIDIPNDFKYSVVTNSIPFFESLIRRYPKNLDINISVILVDLENFKVIKEQYVCYNHEADIEWLDKLRIASENE